MSARRCTRHLHTHWIPLGIIVGIFIGSRILIDLLGVQFDRSPLPWFWQYIDPELLKHDFFESVWNLHIQPPLTNVFLGVMLNLFPHDFSTTTHLVFMLLGLAQAVTIYLLLWRLGVNRALSTTVAVLFSVLPLSLMYENYLFYEYAVMVLVTVAALSLQIFVSRPTFWRGFAFFALIGTLIYLRSMFQLAYLLILIAFFLLLIKDHRRLILKSALVPLLAVVLLYTKNAVMFGFFGSTSWLGSSLAKVTVAELPTEKRLELVRQGKLHRIETIGVFNQLHEYYRYIKRPAKTGIEVLDTEYKTTGGGRNMNNLAYVELSRLQFSDGLTSLREEPIHYIRYRKASFQDYFTPSTDYDFLSASNLRAIQEWDEIVDTVLYGQPKQGSTGVLIAFWYLLAFIYGLVVLVGVIRRRLAQPFDLAVLFIWFTALYVTVVSIALEVGENQRDRIVSEPLVLVLLTLAGTSVVRKLRTRRSSMTT